jgi:hypothetical protein
MSLRKLLVFVLFAAGAARADGTASTLFDSRPFVRDGGYQESPIYESFSLFAKSDGTDWLQDVRISARGWARLTLGPPFDDHRTAGDVDSLFLEARLLKRHLLVRIGRQLQIGGAARATQFDGVSARGIVTNGFGVEVFGGAPVQPRFAVSNGDVIAGGRVFWSHAFDSEVGASYVYALHRGYVARNDFALDGSYTPLRAVTVSGIAQWSLEEARLAEAKLQALWQVTQKITVTADVQRTEPDLFLDRDSIFAVFSEEVRNEAGGEAVWRVLQPLSISADWHWLNVEGGHGERGGTRATFHTPQGGSYGVELRLLTEPDNGYKQARVFATRKLHQFLVTVDLDAYWLEQEINTQKHSLMATATCGFPINSRWDAMIAGSLGTTPYFERRVELIARLTYKFGLPGGLK